MGFYSVATKKEGDKFECFLLLHTFGVFRISRSWGISRFANLPLIIYLGEKGLTKSYKKQQILTRMKKLHHLP